jgi:hypothetical protein
MNETEFICLAYPSGIPDAVIKKEVLHNKLLEDQMGDYLYERLVIVE